MSFEDKAFKITEIISKNTEQKYKILEIVKLF